MRTGGRNALYFKSSTVIAVGSNRRDAREPTTWTEKKLKGRNWAFTEEYGVCTSSPVPSAPLSSLLAWGIELNFGWGLSYLSPNPPPIFLSPNPP
jgi:hypothetical protein